MYAYLRGQLASVFEDGIIVDVHDVGYRVLMSGASISCLPPVGEEVKIYTYTCVREDAFLLYGFLSQADLDIFKQCITVSGIGPKGGMAILSVMDADALRFAILSGDSKSIARAPGIGPKTAQRLILELKDKISVEDVLAQRAMEGGVSVAGSVTASTNMQEAVEALTALGYSSSDALRAVKSVENAAELDVEVLLKQALKHMF
ncbi:MAG: Holliday junction branch migration protein RuvA [Lachnospiraceae bacterium]|nr:Holliday junction branch migration protein RuvA [Lachnospiraceae bacterium]